MSAVEEIQAAIDKLTGLEAESTRGPWHRADAEFYGVIWSQETEADPSDPTGQTPMPVQFDLAHVARAQDIDLIVALHASLDPLLDVLRESLAWERRVASYRQPSQSDEHVIALALAINGGTK